jgi:hypothetical protein
MKQLFGVVSDVLCGKSLHWCTTAEQAETACCEEQCAATPRDDESHFTPANFKAWPEIAWPHHLSFEAAFDWIKEQRNPTTPGSTEEE